MKRVDDELRAAGGSTAGADGAGGALTSLTPQELHVALTVARGATNREVATALYLSPKTVEFHLSQVYRKLSIRSRTELAARIVGIEGVPDPGGGGVSGAASAVPTSSPPASGASRPVRAGGG